MRRTPLVRKAPMARGGAPRPSETPKTQQPPLLDLVAAAKALTRRQQSAETPRAAHQTVPDPVRTPKRATTGFPPAVRQLILERDAYTCARCGIALDTSSWGYSLQHRDNRGMGGTKAPGANMASNGLALCGSATTGCHGRVEANPEYAERFGYAVQSWADPATVPVHTAMHGWVLLNYDGTLTLVDAPPTGNAHDVSRYQDGQR